MPVTICCNGSDAIRRTLDGAQRFGIDCGLETSQAARLAIVVEELVTNLVEHGGVGDADEIELILSHSDNRVALVLADSGTPFDPRGAESPDVVPERGGGAGIDLVRAWADIIDYRREAGRNRLHLRMKPGG